MNYIRAGIGAGLIACIAAVALAGNHVDYALSPEWTLFQKPAMEDVDLTSIHEIPETLGGVPGRKIRFNEHDAYPVDDPSPPSFQRVAIFMNAFESPRAGLMQIGCSADWFFEFMINGQVVYDTLETGNQIAFPMTTEDHLFDVPVHKGTNLVVIRLLSGGKGWRLHCGPPRKRFDLDRVSPTLENLKTEAARIYSTSPFRPDGVRMDVMRLIQNGANQITHTNYTDYLRHDVALSEAEAARYHEQWPVLHFYEHAFDKVLSEVQTEVVPPGKVVFWHLYNMGYIVKTPTSCFGIDLHHRRAERLAPHLDFLMTTHAHGDHFNQPLINRMVALRKPVLSNFHDAAAKTNHPGEYALGDVVVRTTLSDHGRKLRKFNVVYEVVCKTGARQCTILHTGDTSWLGPFIAPKERVDVYIMHPQVGIMIEDAIARIKPGWIFISHIQELSHPIAKFRWGYGLGEFWQQRARDVGYDKALVPLWGERIVWLAEDDQLPPQQTGRKPK